MYAIILNTLPALIFFEVSRTVVSTCSAGVVLFVIAVVATKNDAVRARGLDKFVALANLCFALPLGVFGAEHFAAARGIMQGVPKYMPWPLFWTYFVGAGLVAASLSIATKIQVRWSGLLFGIMMFLFVAMMDIPGTLGDIHNRISWVLMFRELSFGAGGWMLAAAAMKGRPTQGKRAFVTLGRLVIGVAAVLYGIQNFLHPINAPGVPLEKVIPTWIPARLLIGYLTSAILFVAGLCIVLNKKARMAAAYLGTWIFLLVVFVYGPILIASLLTPSTDVKVEGINYFFDTLLYAGTVLGLASALARLEENQFSPSMDAGRLDHSRDSEGSVHLGAAR
jgi:uncharacterized membrane protein YphA (DoxX/SURF4 family)